LSSNSSYLQYRFLSGGDASVHIASVSINLQGGTDTNAIFDGAAGPARNSDSEWGPDVSLVSGLVASDINTPAGGVDNTATMNITFDAGTFATGDGFNLNIDVDQLTSSSDGAASSFATQGVTATVVLEDGRTLTATFTAVDGDTSRAVFDFTQAIDDTLNGGDGNDALTGGLGNDVLNGGNGIDTAVYIDAPSSVTVNLAAGTATGGDGNDTLNSIENVIGSAHNDTLTGDAIANVLNGGAGGDSLMGGTGNDTFVFKSVIDSEPGAGQFDTIADFTHNSDHIDLTAIAGATSVQGLVATAATVGANSISWFVDNAHNETILYVNTSATANHVDMEIHLTGTNINLSGSDILHHT
jgi:Ca2+-binding RTX toxin-like protein